MSPRFAARDDGQDEVALMEAEIERVSSLSLPHLASEVMIRGFGPGGPGQPGTPEAPTIQGVPRTSAFTIARAFTPAHQAKGVASGQRLRLEMMIAEGLQILEHACLIRPETHANSSTLSYVATRLGRAAVERGEVDHLLSDGNH